MSDWISRQAAIEVADALWTVTGDVNVAKVWDQLKDLPSAQSEPLTDREMRLFYAAMARERQICRDIDTKFGDHELLSMCNAIERKVKAALWREHE